jgi:hypothetical protein
MCVCLYVHMYVYKHVCMDTCVCVNACACACVFACMNILPSWNRDWCVRMCVYVCMYVCMYASVSYNQKQYMGSRFHVSTYAFMRVCMHSCKYVCIHACMQGILGIESGSHVWVYVSVHVFMLVIYVCMYAYIKTRTYKQFTCAGHYWRWCE